LLNKLSLRLSCQIYLLLILLVAAILSPLPYSPLALILLAVMLFTTLRPLQPRLNVAITVVAIFLLPSVLEPFLQYLTYTTPLSPTVAQIITVMSILPIIYLLDYNLRQNAQDMTLTHKVKGTHITNILTALFVSTLAVLLISFIVNNPILLFTTIILALYLLVILIRVLRAIPSLPFNVPLIGKRVIAGTTADVSLYLTSKAPIRLHSLVSPVDPWVKITPQRFTLNKAIIQLNLTITPPLAGPSRPQFQVSVIDPQGFTQVNQVIEPMELHVIPRARYAKWLAMKYLERTATGVAVATTTPKATLIPKRGVEYSDSRSYQPGDPLRAIDWKHTIKLNQLIIKEYVETGGQAAIIAVNLSVTDAEEADKLAFNLITTALTLAYDTIPTALAVYNHQKVVVTTAVINPREILKQTLLLVKDITLVEFGHRFLQPPDIGKLRRNITQLKQVTSEPAQQLLNMLNFEYQAIEEGAKNHPATLALSTVIEHTPPPATILLVSQLNHDAEALPVTLEKLSMRGFTTIPIRASR